MARLNFSPGIKVTYNGKPAVIIKVVDLDAISIQLLESNVIHTVKPNQVEPFKDEHSKSTPFDALTDKEWNKAQRRYEIIKPILDGNADTEKIKEIAQANSTHYTTLYRWIKLYNDSGLVSSLAGSKKNGGKDKSRLTPEIDDVINNTILELYLDSSKKSISKVIRTITMKCKELDLSPPHANTIRNRIKSLSEEEVMRARYGRKKSRDKFESHKGSFPGATFPLSIVQIDHTVVDIILVDEFYRKPFRRPFITVAIDVFSRMVVGFHLSFDPPGEMGTGLCIANAILGKEMQLEKHGISGEWPCWGTPATIHLDNAKEFRGEMLKRTCLNYGINIEHRPVATPHWGGHIERLLGTFSNEIHNLPGTTFSNVADRENYDSKAKAALTINEFEKWLMIYIVNVYHKKIHSAINMPPIDLYRKGVFGDANNNGVGIPPKLLDERRVRLDFMPFVERTIQEYGIVIDHIQYYDEVMRKYIHAREDQTKYSKKRKFIFKRDPRDISTIYFLDPELNEYFDIPYRDTSKPPISIWEFNEVVTKLQKNNLQVNEDSIFEAYKAMDEIELKAIKETKKLKKHSRLSDKRNEDIHSTLKQSEKENNNNSITEKINSSILPFEDLDDEAFI